MDGWLPSLFGVFISTQVALSCVQSTASGVTILSCFLALWLIHSRIGNFFFFLEGRGWWFCFEGLFLLCSSLLFILFSSHSARGHLNPWAPISQSYAQTTGLWELYIFPIKLTLTLQRTCDSWDQRQNEQDMLACYEGISFVLVLYFSHTGKSV